MMRRLHINTKIRFMSLFILFIIAVMACIGINGVARSKQLTDNIVDKTLPTFDKLVDLNISDSAIRCSQKVLLIPDLDKINKPMEEIDKITEETKNFDSIVAELDIIYETNPSLSPEERQHWTEFKEHWTELKSNYQQYLNKMSSYHSTGNEELYRGAYNYNRDVLEPHYQETYEHIYELIELGRADILLEQVEIKEVTLTIRILLVLSFLIGIFTFIVISVYAIRFIKNPVVKAIKNLNQLALQLASASEQVNASGQQLAEGNAEIASSIEETASTIEEFTSIITQNNKNTHSAAMLSQKTNALAKDGIREMGDMKKIIDEIKKSSGQMAKIINIIDEISFQTNILAINAAVEAARAGDAGQSFAVVADEIRNLSQRSAQAAKVTADIIETNIELSESGVNETSKIAGNLEQIADSAVKLNELIDEVAVSSQEQTHGITSISGAMAQMEKITQANAVNAEESASSAEELNGQATLLSCVADDLYTMVYGSKTPVNSDDDRTPPPAVKENTGNNDKINKSSFVVTPEDIIPFEKDNGGF